MSLLWGWLFDRTPPDTYDIIGALIILIEPQSYFIGQERMISMIDLKVSLALFFLAALFEIGGGYLVLLWFRENKGVAYGLLGGVVLTVYGIVPTLQPAHFGRVYAAYGGIFIISSLMWGALVDKKKPDRFEIITAPIYS